MKNRLLLLLLLFLCWGSTASAMEISGFKNLMRQLQQDFSTLQAALLSGDLNQAAQAADAIAHHQPPPLEERKWIMTRLGKQALKFKEWDQQVHQATKRLAEAAQAKDRKKAQELYQQALQGCFGCHHQFRKRLRQP